MPTTSFDLRRLLGVALALTVLGLGATGCGGGGDDDASAPAAATTGTTEPVAITTDELIDQGDKICAEVNAAVGSIDGSTADETTKASQREGIYDGLAQRLGELGTPSDGDPPTDVIAAVQDLADGSTDTTALQSAAEDYGFTDCAEPPSAPTTSSEPSNGAGSSTGTDTDPSYAPPATNEPAPAPAPAPAPSTGGGVAPTPAPSGGGTGGSSGGGSSGGSAGSGGIGPG